MTLRLALALALLAAAPLAAMRPAPSAGTGGSAASAAAEAQAAQAAPATAPVPSAVPSADPCDPSVAPPEAADARGSLRPAARRVAVVCALRDAMASRYVFWPVKGRALAAGRAPVDARAHLDACVEAERAIPSEEVPLRFYDRMRRCIGAFEDGHLIVTVPGRLPAVALGVGFRLAGGRVVVANREAELIRDLAATRGPADLAALLAPGTELLSVDGVPALEAVDTLAALVPGSSPAARRERAVDALGRRDFAHPSRAEAELLLAAPGGRRARVVLPWWVAPGADEHAVAGPWVARLGLVTSALVDWRASAAADADAHGRVGARRTDPIAPAAGLRVLRGETGQVAARLGELPPAAGGAPYCYAQLLSFHTDTLADGEGKRPYAAVLADFVAGCERAGRDLLLDLRQNEGGYISHSTALARALVPTGATAPGGALLVRATDQNERVYTERAPVLGGSGGGDGEPLAPGRILAAIGEARRTNREFTPAFLERPLAPAGDGFRGRVVALTSPACMSACDRLAGLLRASGRAVLVGGPTEGAGGSQQETKGQSARWTDPAGLLAVSIPNAAMGIQPSGFPPGADADADAFFAALAFENHPVVPHVAYATSLEDVVHANAGWRAAAEQALGR
jgi:hypothetical protein